MSKWSKTISEGVTQVSLNYNGPQLWVQRK
jgi:hypothetical protein